MGGYKQKGSTIAIKSLKKVSDRKFQTTAGNHKPIMVMKKMAYSALILSLLQYFFGEKNYTIEKTSELLHMILF